MEITVPISENETRKQRRAPKRWDQDNPMARKRVLDGDDEVGPLRVPTDRDWLFINEYLKSGNAVASYRAAGYNGTSEGSNAYKMLRKPIIQHTISKIMHRKFLAAARSCEITAAKVLGDLEEARVGAMEDRQYSAAVKASELHGKSLGMFGDDYHTKDQAPLISITNYNQTLITDSHLNPPSPLGVAMLEIDAGDIQEL